MELDEGAGVDVAVEDEDKDEGEDDVVDEEVVCVEDVSKLEEEEEALVELVVEEVVEGEVVVFGEEVAVAVEGEEEDV